MDKFTVIIPTLWKSKRIHELLQNLILEEKVGEIILIDNSNQFFNFYETAFDKVVLVQPHSNMYVNPAWNLGVNMATYDNIAILNDDVSFDMKLFDLIPLGILVDLGVIGMGQENYAASIADTSPYLQQWHPGIDDWGWGCILFFHKSNWKPIPKNLLIWCGDNFIKDAFKCQKYVLRGFKIETEMSTTSDLNEFDDIKKQDVKNYESIIYETSN